MKKLILTSFFLLLTSFIFCQKGSISGVITDDKKEGLPGVTISIEKTTKATSADIDGSYKLGDIEPGKHIVVFSMIGYSTQKKEINVTAGQDIKINITLKEDVLNLEEVVVVGYGRRQKRDVTGSIETIKSGELEQIVVPSFDQALQGLASGVQVTAANGVAGAPVKINVRGNSSISAGSEPLYVIDGIPMTTGDFSPGNLGSLTNALSDINPNDIESIEVLKDAAAAAIYGSRGSNGVILITTKKGKAGKTKFNAGFYTGIVNSSNRLELLNASEHLALRDKAQKAIAVFYNDTSFKPEAKNKAIYGKWTRGQADSLAALGGTDWIDKVLRTGLVQEGNISAQGGNDKTVFYIGGSYYKEKGFLVGNNFDRINGRVNLENNAANSLKIGTDIGLAYTKNVRVPIGDAGGLGDAQRLFPYIPVYNRDGSYFYPTIPNYPGNAVWEIDNQHFTAKSFRAVPKIYADLDLSKLLFSETDNSQQSTNSELKFRSEFGMDVLQQVEEEFDFRNVEDPTSTSTAWDRATNVINYTINNYFTYNLKLKEIHNFNFTLGNSLEKSKTKGFGLNGYDFSNDFYTSPGNATSSNQSGYAYNTGYAFLSYFFRVNYKFRDRYLAGLSIRDDGSSRFGSENRYGWFPAFSAGWIVTEENFMQDIKKLSFLKLRASYRKCKHWRFCISRIIQYYKRLCRRIRCCSRLSAKPEIRMGKSCSA
jgi:TonB-linked SusC/RagA family outer membrane protein